MGSDSEVYKARSKRNRSIVALKKILMHNEKDGVSFNYVLRKVPADHCILVSHYSPARGKASQDAIASEYSATSGNVCRAQQRFEIGR